MKVALSIERMVSMMNVKESMTCRYGNYLQSVLIGCLFQD